MPALAATVSITALVADEMQLIEEATSALASAPTETQNFLVGQLESIVESDSGGVGAAAAVGVVLALFSASGAMGQLMTALSIINDRVDTRSFILRRLIAVGLVVGAIVMIGAMVGAMPVLTAVLDQIDQGWLRWLANIGRFLGLGLLMVVGLSILYRIGPGPEVRNTYELVPGGRKPLISIGAVVGAIGFVVASWLFGIFVTNFGSYNETYGTLATIIVVLLWLQICALMILIGAEVEATRRSRAVVDARVSAGLDPKVPVLDE